jgi:hypothetical protein
MRAPLLLATFAVAASAGCVRAPDLLVLTEDVVAVHAVLHASSSEPRVWVQRSTFAGSFAPGSASASLSGEGRTLTLAQVKADRPEGCGFAGWGDEALRGCLGGTLEAPITPGSRWSLTATVEGLGTVHGVTTVPLAPVVTQPAPGARVVYAPGPFPESATAEIELVWAAAGSPRVEFGARPATAFRGGEPLHGAQCSAWVWARPALERASGTLPMRLDAVFCRDAQHQPVAWDSMAVDVRVVAYDSAFARYALYGASASRGRGGRGLEGGYGVLGSAATTERQVMLVPR